MKFKRGDIVLARFGWNKVLERPFEFLYEFGYYTDDGKCVVYVEGETNMQSSSIFDENLLEKIKSKNIHKYFWGR